MWMKSSVWFLGLMMASGQLPFNMHMYIYIYVYIEWLMSLVGYGNLIRSLTATLFLHRGVSAKCFRSTYLRRHIEACSF